MASTDSLNKQIAEQAASWAVTLDDGPLNHQQKRDLLHWLKTSPVHLDEFLFALSLLEGVSLSSSEKTTEIDELLAAAMADVVPLSEAAPVSRLDVPRAAPLKQQVLRLGAIAACFMLLVSVAYQLVAPSFQSVTSPDLIIVTDLGEQRSVRLEDESVVYINTQSRLTVTYTDNARTIEVEEGEALFDVKTDPDRPFRVHAGDTLAEALGTRFNVRYLGGETQVSVVEGRVAFERPSQAFDRFLIEPHERTDNAPESLGALRDGRVILVTGERAELAATSAIPTLLTANTDTISAWTTRRLIFDEDSLSNVVAEFNRYNRMKLIIENESLSERLISGVFAVDDPTSLVDFLAFTDNVEIIRDKNTITIASSTE